MERLSPNERAVYVLREAFDYPHREIAEILDITEAASQQIFHRAKKHVADGRARTEVDEAAARRIVEEFLAAATSGRTEPLVRLLTEDAVAIGDGGGKVPARAKAFEGALAVAKFLRGLFKPGEAKRALVGGTPEVYAWTANGDPAVVAVVDGRVVGVMCLEVTADGIAAFRSQVNPDKLDRATERWAAADHGEPLFERLLTVHVRCFTARSCQETAGCPVQGANPQRDRSTDMQHRIIVLGAGYTGAIAAGRLAKRLHREDVAITLVNAEPDFVERVRMHQLATGQDLKPRPFSEMFAGTGVELKLAKVTGVDVDRKTVTVIDANGAEELAYDTLVYALGSGWNAQGVPGTAEHAYEIASRPGALRLRERLARLDAGQTVVVVGGGLTGLEAATEIAEARPDLDVALAARGGLGDWLSPKGRRHLRKVFGRLGITVHEHAAVTGVEADRVTTADGTAIPAAVTVWTTGFAVHPIAAATTLEVTDTGQIVVDGTMRSVSHPDVYAIGDAAFAMGPGDKPLRMSCASGAPDGVAGRRRHRGAPDRREAPERAAPLLQPVHLAGPQGGPDPVRHRRRPRRPGGPDRTARRRLQGAGLQGRGLGRRQPDARAADPAPPRRRRSPRMDYLIRAGMDRATMPLAA